MERRDLRGLMLYTALTLAAVGGVVQVLRPHDPDIDFCRGVFAALAKGRLSVQDRIDWEHLTALDVNVGEAFAKLPTSQDRTRYKYAFIIGFSQGFRGAGGGVGAFVNWRVHERRGETVTVAADYPRHGKTILLVMSARGERRLESIQWEEPASRDG